MVCALTFSDQALGEETRVPPRLQAELLAKVAAYDGKFSARAQGRALVLIVVASGVADSERFGAQIRAELGKQPRIGGVEHMEDSIRYSSAAELARVCRERKPAIVYLGPGLSEHAPAIAEALAGLDLISVSALPNDVARGTCSASRSSAGKPKLLVHLPQASDCRRCQAVLGDRDHRAAERAVLRRDLDALDALVGRQYFTPDGIATGWLRARSPSCPISKRTTCWTRSMPT